LTSPLPQCKLGRSNAAETTVTTRDTLLQLARQDARLFQLRQQIANLPRRLQELDSQRLKLQVQLKEAEGRLQQADAGCRKLENEVTEYRQRKAKSESRLALLTSTEQYQALLKEIQSHTEKIDGLESQILEAMERSEQSERALAGERTRVQQAVEALDAQQRSLESDLAAARAVLPTEGEKREMYLAEIESPTRTVYDRILKAKGDAGLALVAGQSCGICKAVQPPQVLQMLRQGTTTKACQMCGRLLVWDGDGA
jgi:predicted  nucleic acid-binding Zn-ribbon protein